MDPEVLELVRTVAPVAAIIVGISVGGWVLTTWMRIKNGYPTGWWLGPGGLSQNRPGIGRADQAAEHRKCAAAR